MNPPFSASAHVDRPHGRRRLAACRVGAWRGSPKAGAWSRSPARASRPDNPAWRDAFVRLQERGRVVFSAAIDGAVYARHGTTIETRLTVIDRVPADDPTAFPASPGMAPDAATLLDWVTRARAAAAADRGGRRRSADRASVRSADRSAPTRMRRVRHRGSARGSRRRSNSPTRPSTGRRPRAAASPRRSTKTTRLQSIRIPGAQPHPTKLVQSAAMASVAPPEPVLSAASAGQRRRRRPPVRRAARKRHLCRRGACRLPRRVVDGRRDLRPRRAPRPTMPRMPCASGAAGFWATAPAPARAARSPASCSTTGSRAAAARSGSPSPTS